MAEDKDSKTEKPTGRRISQARDKGQVARSQDLSMAVLLLIAAAVMTTYGGHIGAAMMDNMRNSLCAAPAKVFGIIEVTRILQGSMLFVIKLISPISAAFVLAGIAVGILQVGWKLSTKSLEFKPDKLNPVQGVKKLINLRSIAKMGFSLIKFIILGGVLYLVLKDRMELILVLSRMDLSAAASTMIGLAIDVLWTISLVLIVLGIIDYIYQKWQHTRDLMMSKQEVKDESKNTEGDPQIKSRIKQAQRRMARLRMMQDVPQADVVITNPVHAAVALKYDQDVMAAPKVVAKGWNEVALRIKEIAKQSGVPIYEEPPLARGLCGAVEVGDEIPLKFYQAVAAVLSHVYQLAGKAPAAAGGIGS